MSSKATPHEVGAAHPHSQNGRDGDPSFRLQMLHCNQRYGTCESKPQYPPHFDEPPASAGTTTTMNGSPSHLAAMATLFSSGVVNQLARAGRSGVFAGLLTEISAILDTSNAPRVRDVFELAFQTLWRSGYRHEYIYRAALTHKVLLGTHSLHTASMLTEFRVGGSRADIAILNGTATVYEIKSERDSLARLERQIEAYKKFFARVYIIAGDNHIDSISQLVSRDVGIMRLSDRYQISTLRAADDRPDRTEADAIFDSVRLTEAVAILRTLDLPVPAVPNTQLHAALRERFAGLPSTLVHAAMIEVLKKTRALHKLSDLVEQLPRSLHSAALSKRMSSSERSRLVAALETPLATAARWNQ